MSNTTNVNAIIANLETILGTTLSWQLEDFSSDKDLNTTPGTMVIYDGETFFDSFGEHPKHNDLNITVLVRFKNKAPGTSRDSQVAHIHSLREGITEAKLNIGALAGTHRVTRVDHDGATVTYDPPITQISYELKIRYREV